MTIILTEQESENLFFDAMCNALGYIQSYGIEVSYDDKDYEEAQVNLTAKLKPNTCICYEDVLMEILRNGKTLTMVDNENGEDDKAITLKEVHERVQKTPTKHLMDAIDEVGDATTSDVILQMVFYEDVIFG